MKQSPEIMLWASNNHIELKKITTTFQNDCGPHHMADSVTQWLHANLVATFPWPGNLPDLSLIEICVGI